MVEKKVVSIRLAEEQAKYLAYTARRMGRTPSQVAAMFVDEALRMEQFPLIEFKDLGSGRTAFIRGTRLKVWMMVSFFREGVTPEEEAEALGVPVEWMYTARDYGDAYPDEIDAAIADDEAAGELIRKLPGFVDLAARASAS